MRDREEVDLLPARLRGVAARWQLCPDEMASVLRLEPDAARRLLQPRSRAKLTGEAELRARNLIEVDRALSRAIASDFLTAAWLRLGSRPRIDRLAGEIACARAVRVEAEGLGS
jgi:hypothetical protein